MTWPHHHVERGKRASNYASGHCMARCFADCSCLATNWASHAPVHVPVSSVCPCFPVRKTQMTWSLLSTGHEQTLAVTTGSLELECSLSLEHHNGEGSLWVIIQICQKNRWAFNGNSAWTTCDGLSPSLLVPLACVSAGRSEPAGVVSDSAYGGDWLWWLLRRARKDVNLDCGGCHGLNKQNDASGSKNWWL